MAIDVTITTADGETTTHENVHAVHLRDGGVLTVELASQTPTISYSPSWWRTYELKGQSDSRTSWARGV